MDFSNSMGVRFGETGEDQLTVGQTLHDETGNGFQMVERVFHGPAEQPIEPTEPVSDTQLVSSSEPISQFPTLDHEPISQFEPLTADATHVDELFHGEDSVSGVVSDMEFLSLLTDLTSEGQWALTRVTVKVRSLLTLTKQGTQFAMLLKR